MPPVKSQRITARVTPQIRRLAEAAADLRDITLSCFAAEAIGDAARDSLSSQFRPPSGEIREDGSDR